MNFIFFLLLLLISAISGFTVFNRRNLRYKRAADFISDKEAIDYLCEFGYIQPSEHVICSSKSSEDFETWAEIIENAVKAFQEFTDLKRTGELDEKTRQKMAEERCGVADNKNVRLSSYTPEKNKEMTYAILSFSSDLPEIDVKNVIRQAFDIWSAEIPQTFREVPSSDTTANIKIQFEKRVHGDPWPFDGTNGIMAHANLCVENQLCYIHFDDDEEWTRNKKFDIVSFNVHDLLSVALHEIGHTLGLAHTSVEGSVMSAFYKPPIFIYLEPRLLPSDIDDIQEIYGKKVKRDRMVEFIEASITATNSTATEAVQPNNCPFLQKNKDVAVSAIKFVKAALSDCCEICKITPKCIAYSWNDRYGGTCWLKSATWPIIDANDVLLGIL